MQKYGSDSLLQAMLENRGTVNATKISNNGKHIAGWTAVDGYFASFKLTLDQLYVCRKDKSMRVGYPDAVADQLSQGATLGMCEADLPLQYKGNF